MVARVGDIGVGERVIVEIGGRSIGVFNVDGRFYAVLNRCPHGGAEICKGQVVSAVTSERPGEIEIDPTKKFLACPWHGWEFDLETGQSWFDPVRTRARMFEVGVSSGELVTSKLDAGEAAVADIGTAEVVDGTTHRIKGPFTAEVLPVQIEDDYVVVSLRPPTAPAASGTEEGE
ncbi:MAG: Rieske 2Fe-2S domain-containing protein [Leifsonia sp.]